MTVSKIALVHGEELQLRMSVENAEEMDLHALLLTVRLKSLAQSVE